jgi:hypothetical protein
MVARCSRQPHRDAKAESATVDSAAVPLNAESAMTHIMSPTQVISALIEGRVEIDDNLAAEIIDALEAAGWRFVYSR